MVGAGRSVSLPCEPMAKNEEKLEELRREAPDAPGVYVFRDRAGEALYVGKANSIRKRVASHFAGRGGRSGLGSTTELRDVPAVAVCAQCGDPDCPGHDFERSGERPIHRLLPWEDGETPPMRSLWRTAMSTASDLELWVRASRSTGNGVGPAFTFALACELVAVVATTVPMAAIVGTAAWLLFHE